MTFHGLRTASLEKSMRTELANKFAPLSAGGFLLGRESRNAFYRILLPQIPQKLK
ncbi:hypothetical protein J2X83_005977 [Brevibacillus nitrificans]|nr:hypothetical protein [Brevibacillus nitrificans]